MKVEQPAQEPPGGVSEASPGKTRRKGDVSSSSDANTEAQDATLSPKQPQDSEIPAKTAQNEDRRGGTNANDAEDAAVHLNVDAPTFEPKAAESNEPNGAGTTEVCSETFSCASSGGCGLE